MGVHSKRNGAPGVGSGRGRWVGGPNAFWLQETGGRSRLSAWLDNHSAAQWPMVPRGTIEPACPSRQRPMTM